MSLLKFLEEDAKTKSLRELLQRLEEEPTRQWEYFHRNNTTKRKGST